MRSKQWQSQGKQAEPPDPFNQTLKLYQEQATRITSALIEHALLGEAWNPTKLADSSRQSVETGAVLYWGLRAMGALSLLQSWMETNASEITLPVKTLLTNSMLGALLVMEVHSNIMACLTYLDVLGEAPQGPGPNTD